MFSWLLIIGVWLFIYMSRRLEQVSSLLQQDVAAIIRRELEFASGIVVSVGRVVLGPDLKFARIYVSVLPESAAVAALKQLQNNRTNIQKQLVANLTMKFTPKISFSLDDTESKASRIESLIDSLRAGR